MMPKSTKQLAKHKKVSADCLTRVRQASEQQQLDVSRDHRRTTAMCLGYGMILLLNVTRTTQNALPIRSGWNM